MFSHIGHVYQITIIEWNHDIDHVHVFFKACPNSNISKFFNAYKSASSRLIKMEYPDIKNKLWKEYTDVDEKGESKLGLQKGSDANGDYLDILFLFNNLLNRLLESTLTIRILL